MKKDELLDIEIKEKLKKEINHVPDNINNAFEAGMNTVIKKKRFNYKRIASIIVIVLVTTIALSVTLATYASDIPILKNIFESLKEGGKEKELNIDLNNIQLDFKVNSFITTPNNTILETSNSYYGNTILNFIAFDNNGNYVSSDGKESMSYWKESDELQEYIAYKFKRLENDVDAVTFIPYICVFQTTSQQEYRPNYDITPAETATKMEVKLNLNGSTKLTTKYGEEYGEITKVEILDDKTNLYYKPNKGSYKIFEQIYDSNKTFDAAYPVDYYYENEEPTTKYLKETREFIITFTKPLEQKEYTLVYYDYSKSEVYYFDEVFTVDVTK